MKKASFVLVVLLVLIANSLVLAQPAKVLLLEPETEDALFSLACDVHIWMKASFGKNENYLELLDLKQARDTLAKKGIYLSRCKTNNEYYKVGGVLHADKIIYTKLYSIDQHYIFSATVFDVINKQVLYQKETDVNIAYKKDIYDFTNNAAKELADTIFNIPNNTLGKGEDTSLAYGDFGLKREGLHSLRELSDIIGKEEFNSFTKVKYKKMPVLIKGEKILFPDSIRSKGIGGKVNLHVLINDEGHVSRIEIAKSSNSTLLDSLAKQAVNKFEYSPGIDSNGIAHKVWVIIQIDFDLIKGAVEYEDKYFAGMEKSPEIIKKVAPIYPSVAKVNGDQGKVILYLLLGIDGRVKQADIAKSSGSALLDEAAREAAYQFMFTPAIAPGGKPVSVWVMYPVNFSLE